jgi:hypothetical protein
VIRISLAPPQYQKMPSFFNQPTNALLKLGARPKAFTLVCGRVLSELGLFIGCSPRRQNGGDVSDRGEKSGVPRGEKWLIVVTLW